MACGKHTQRSTTQQICRKCHIPLLQADDHLAKYLPKTVQEILKLVDDADHEGLKKISQTHLRNAFYNLRFSMGNGYGVHGSCPSEMLHAILLGIFKYLRDIFFEQVGRTGEGAKLMNALSKIYAKKFTRQSDRTMPGTGFSKGIQVGKLMAKDYRGVLLIMLAMVRSTKGRAILRKYRNFKDQAALDDWILLLELMLEWESHLNEPQMEIKHVKRLEKKHRFIMCIMRKVAQRVKGMGLKLLKFHTILHLWEDTLQFGIPLECDTSANESMHKPSKKASKMTQKTHDTFNYQTGQRLVEFTLIDLAMEEILTGKKMWDYYDRKLEQEGEETAEEEEETDETWTGETQIKVFCTDEGEECFSLRSRSKFAAQTYWNQEVTGFLIRLQAKVEEFIGTDSLPIFTSHHRNGQVFRGHPNFRGKGAWKDWVWVDWGRGFGRLPSHIWCFVTLRGMPSGRNTIHHGGIGLKDGVFAVVETAALEENEELIGQSDLLTPILKDVQLDEDEIVKERMFYLADTEAFSDPCCVIPDIGGPTNRYFVVKPRNQWAKEFIKWVQDEHHLDEMDELQPLEEEKSDTADEDGPTEAKKQSKKKRKTRRK